MELDSETYIHDSLLLNSLIIISTSDKHAWYHINNDQRKSEIPGNSVYSEFRIFYLKFFGHYW
jgi:hypothetical protein